MLTNLFLALLAFQDNPVGTLTCHQAPHKDGWGANMCVLRLAVPLQEENWVLWGFTSNTVLGARYPAGSQTIGFQVSAEFTPELVQVNGDTDHTIVAHWQEDPLVVLKAQAIQRPGFLKRVWKRITRR